MKKIIIIIGILLLVGCGSKEIDKASQIIKQSYNNINSYTLDLRIYGVLNNKKVNESVRIKKFDNVYEINIKNNDDITSIISEKYKYGYNENENVIYINSKETYIYDKDKNKYVKANDMLKYTNPFVYLGTLDHLKKISNIGEEKIGKQSYKKYEVVVEDDIIKNIIKDATLNEIKIDKNKNVTIYLDKNNKLYRVMYYFKDITINASYFGINEEPPIILPNEI